MKVCEEPQCQLVHSQLLVTEQPRTHNDDREEEGASYEERDAVHEGEVVAVSSCEGVARDSHRR